MEKDIPLPSSSKQTTIKEAVEHNESNSGNYSIQDFLGNLETFEEEEEYIEIHFKEVRVNDFVLVKLSYGAPSNKKNTE